MTFYSYVKKPNLCRRTAGPCNRSHSTCNCIVCLAIITLPSIVCVKMFLSLQLKWTILIHVTCHSWHPTHVEGIFTKRDVRDTSKRRTFWPLEICRWDCPVHLHGKVPAKNASGTMLGHPCSIKGQYKWLKVMLDMQKTLPSADAIKYCKWWMNASIQCQYKLR